VVSFDKVYTHFKKNYLLFRAGARIFNRRQETNVLFNRRRNEGPTRVKRPLLVASAVGIFAAIGSKVVLLDTVPKSDKVRVGPKDRIVGDSQVRVAKLFVFSPGPILVLVATRAVWSGGGRRGGAGRGGGVGRGHVGGDFLSLKVKEEEFFYCAVDLSFWMAIYRRTMFHVQLIGSLQKSENVKFFEFRQMWRFG
jgi:hypothetical protein